MQMLVKMLGAWCPAVTPAALGPFHRTLVTSAVHRDALGMGRIHSEGTFLLSRHFSCPGRETDT